MREKKGTIIFNQIDLIAGVVVALGGLMMIGGHTNYGVVVSTVGLLIEAIKTAIQSGVK